MSTYNSSSASIPRDKDSSNFRITSVLSELAMIAPALEYGNNRKNGGKICVVGGSLIHTGAPFFAGQSAVCCGIDEVTVLTTQSAALPIKCYSPALKVLGELPEEKGHINGEEFVTRVWPMVRDNHAFCVGPGIGRSHVTFKAVSKLIEKIRDSEIPLVMDDDALWLLAMEPWLLSKNIPKSPVIVTPNRTEFNRLWVAFAELVQSGVVSSNSSLTLRAPPGTIPGAHSSGRDGASSTEGSWRDIDAKRKSPVGLSPVMNVECPKSKPFHVNKYPEVMAVQQTALLASIIGTNTTIVRKGYIDLIATPSRCFLLSQGQIPRRCVGQGAILAGLCTTFLAWMKLSGNLSNPLLAAEGAAVITRQAAQGAFDRKDRSMQTPDIIAILAGVMEDFLAACGADQDIMVFEREDPGESKSS